MAPWAEISGDETTITLSRHSYRRLVRRTNKLMRLADPLDANYDVLKDLREALLQPLNESIAFPGSTIMSDIVMRVFETAELADQIFAHLDVLELIALKVTSLDLSNVVQQSHVARRQMFLEPGQGPDFTMLDQRIEACMPGVPTWGLGDQSEAHGPYDMDHLFQSLQPATAEQMYFIVKFSARDLDPSRKTLPSSLRALHLCQPPIKDLKSRPACACFPTHAGRDTVVSSSSGFTIGELLDVACAQSVAHQMCPHASPTYHDSKGFVQTEFCYFAQLDSDTSHPPRIMHNRKSASKKSKKDLDNAKSARFGAYIEAKQKAANSGRSVPTFAKWQKGIKKTIRNAEEQKTEDRLSEWE
nr:hypothetical protein B0A51_05097 [Rachicladosporium sp. CCFEE 5018]